MVTGDDGVKLVRTGGRMPVLFPAAVEGAASAAVYGYGPLYMRQVLDEPRLTVTTLMLALAALAWFFAAGAWGRAGDRARRPLGLIGWALLLSAAVQAALPFVPGSAAFIGLVVLWACLLAAVAPLSVSWLTLQAPERPAEEAAGFYRMRSVGWTVGSMGAGLLVGLMDLDGIPAAILITAAASAVVGVAVLVAMRRGVAPVSAARPEAAAAAGEPGPGATSTSTVVHEGESGGSVWRLHAVWTLAAVILLTVTGNEAFFAVLGPYLTEYLPGSLEYVGLSMGVASFLGIGVVGPLGRLADRWGAERVFVLGCLGYVIMYGLVALLRDPLATVILFGLPIFPFMSTGATGTLARRTPARRRGEAIGAYEGTSALA
ncbi:MAG: hypothetical protein BAA04_13075, partial [Firmicutes bacterium ZCTH02-B6]